MSLTAVTARHTKLEVVQPDTSTGVRFNTGKPRPTLLSPYALEGLMQVLEFGARKYSPRNWEKGLPIDQTLDSLMRHLLAMMRGELVDAESGLPHIDHIGANWMFAAHHMRVLPSDGTSRIPSSITPPTPPVPGEE